MKSHSQVLWIRASTMYPLRGKHRLFSVLFYSFVPQIFSAHYVPVTIEDYLMSNYFASGIKNEKFGFRFMGHGLEKIQL